ncbi:MAG: hypothetical protein ACD_12C00303G0001, partial [uncultured bacterium]
MTSEAATESLVDRGLDAHKNTLAPPSFNVIIKLAVSEVTCRQAAKVTPFKVCSFLNLFLIKSKTGI